MGPPITKLNPLCQIPALHVLMPAFDIVSPQSISTSAISTLVVDSPTQSPIPPQAHHINIGSTVGAVIGCTICFLILAAFAIFRCRRNMWLTRLARIGITTRAATCASPSRIDPFVGRPTFPAERKGVSISGSEHVLDEDRLLSRAAADAPQDPSVLYNLDPAATTFQPTDAGEHSAQAGGPAEAATGAQVRLARAEIVQTIQHLLGLLATTRDEVHARRLTMEDARAVSDNASELPPSYGR